MIEIGPNLKEIITNIFDEFRRNNPTCSEYIDFVKQIKELITLSPKAKICEYKSDDKRYPSESGYYWFKDGEVKTIVHFDASLSLIYLWGKSYHVKRLWDGTLKECYFIQPKQPILEPNL